VTPVLDEVLKTKRVVCCVGSGGVGKTTLSAALGLRAALLGRRTLILTIDPAKRLANSLGLATLGNTETRIDAARLADAGLDANAQLWAMTLDLRRTWDDVVTRHAPDAARRDRILNNRLYQQVSTSLAGSLEYMAMEKLHELANSGRYDLVVLDTPPTAHALDFLDAPDRLLDLIDNEAARFLLDPAAGAGRMGISLLQVGSAFVLKTLARFTGTTLLHDLGEFLQGFQGMYEGFKQRAVAVKSLLTGPQSAFVLVTSASPQTVDEAVFLARELRTNGVPVAAAVANRVHLPLEGEGPRDAHGLTAALAHARVPDHGTPPLHTRLADTMTDLVTLAARDRAELARIKVEAATDFPLHVVPRFDADVHDLAGLAQVGAALRLDSET